MSTTKQRGLGKGLGAFFTAPALPDENETKIDISVNELKPNPYQPRKVFSDEKLEDLISSIRQHGIIQPLIIRKTASGYEIVAGERRWRAALKANLDKVPVVIRDYTDKQLMEIALVENIQRHDLNPIEEAHAFKNLMESFGLTQEEVAQRIGRSRPAVANILRMLNLPSKIQDYVSRGTLNMGQAKPLLSLFDEAQQLVVAQRIIEDDMSAREAEQYINNLSARKEKKKNVVDIHLSELQDTVALSLGTKVEIKKSGQKGKIIIDFYSQSDLERLLELFVRPQEQSFSKTKEKFSV